MMYEYPENDTALKVALLTVKSRRYKIHREAANLQRDQVFLPMWVGPRGDNWEKYEDVGRANDDYDRYLRDEMDNGNVCRECMGEFITEEDDAVEEEEQECNDETITEDDDDVVLEEEQQEHQEEEQQVQDFRRSIHNQTTDHYEEARLVKWMHTTIVNGKKVAKSPAWCTFQELQEQKKACKEIRDNGGVASMDVTCTDHHRIRDQSVASQVLSGKVQKEDTTYCDVQLNRLAIRRKSIVLIALHESGFDLETLDVDSIDWPKVTIHCAYSGLPIRYDEMEIADSHHALESCELELEYNGVCYKIEGMAKTDTISEIMNGDSEQGFAERLSDGLSITVAIRSSVHRLTHKGMSMIEKGQVAGVESPIVFHRAEKRVIIDASTYTQFQQFLPAEALVPREDDNEAEDEVAASEVVRSDDIDEDTPGTPEFESTVHSGVVCPPTPTKENHRSKIGFMNLHAEFDLTKDVAEASSSSDANENENDIDMGDVVGVDILRSEQEYEEKNRLKTTNRELSAANTKLLCKVAELEAAVASGQAIIAANEEVETMLLARINERDATIAANEAEEKKLLAIIDERDATIARISEEEETKLLATINDLSSLTKQMEKLTFESKEKDEKIATMQVEHNTHVEELTDAHRVEKETMMRECNQTIESMENRVAASDAAHAVAISTKDEEMSGLREEMADMQIDLRNACNSYHFYRRKTNNMQHQIDELMEEAEHKANVLEENENCINEYKEEVEYLHERVECLDVELQDTKAALSEYESSTFIQVVSAINPWSNKRRKISEDNDD